MAKTTTADSSSTSTGMDAETKATVALARLMAAPALDAAARERIMRNAWARWGPKTTAAESPKAPEQCLEGPAAG